MMKRSKYGNRKTVVDGINFDSAKEALYYQKIKMIKENGKPGVTKKSDLIIEFNRQVKFDLIVNDIKICGYKADFIVYYADGRCEVVDVKGFRTREYIMKKKLMKACHNVDIVEV